MRTLLLLRALDFRPLRFLKSGSSVFSLGGPDFFFQWAYLLTGNMENDCDPYV